MYQDMAQGINSGIHHECIETCTHFLYLDAFWAKPTTLIIEATY